MLQISQQCQHPGTATRSLGAAISIWIHSAKNHPPTFWYLSCLRSGLWGCPTGCLFLPFLCMYLCTRIHTVLWFFVCILRQVSHWPANCQLGQAIWPANCRNLPVSGLPDLGFQACTTTPNFIWVLGTKLRSWCMKYFCDKVTSLTPLLSLWCVSYAFGFFLA